MTPCVHGCCCQAQLPPLVLLDVSLLDRSHWSVSLSPVPRISIPSSCLFFLFNTQFYLCPPYSQHMQFPLLFTGCMKAARHNLFQSLPSSNSFALTLHPFFLNVTWKMSFLSPINAIALWHRVEPWWHNGEQGKCTLRDTAHLSAGKPHLCWFTSSYLLRPILQACDVPKALPPSKFLQAREHRCLGSSTCPLKGWSILYLCVFSFHLLPKPSTSNFYSHHLCWEGSCWGH